MKFMIDVGHGKKGSGAVGKIDEVERSQKLSLYIVEKLARAGHQAMLSRTPDEMPSVSERANRAKKNGCGVLLSVHFNSGGGDGAEAYPQFYGDKAICTESQKLSESILTSMVKAGQGSRGIKKRANTWNTREYFGVLYYSRLAGIPALLLECAFVDTKDALDFDTDTELVKWASAIVSGILAVYPANPVKAYSVVINGTGTRTDAEGLRDKVKAAGFPAILNW